MRQKEQQRVAGGGELQESSNHEQGLQEERRSMGLVLEGGSLSRGRTDRPGGLEE